jgi:hypothetical protein
MKRTRVTIAATVITSFLASLPVSGSELSFNVPSTDRARESAEQLREAAHALYGLPDAGQIKDLWLFPTGDSNTLFAQYTLSAQESAAIPTEHLALVTLDGNRIVALTDLTEAQAESTSEQARLLATPHWSAAIGNGHTSSISARSASHGTPAAPHWSAAIGTGSSARRASASEGKSALLEMPLSAAGVHFTARIGTGHVSESTRDPRMTNSQSTARKSISIDAIER